MLTGKLADDLRSLLVTRILRSLIALKVISEEELQLRCLVTYGCLVLQHGAPELSYRIRPFFSHESAAVYLVDIKHWLNACVRY